MQDALRQVCQQFIENREVSHQVFRWESSYVHPLCANIFTARGLLADGERLAQCRDLIKQHTGVFSNFRGNLRPALAAMLAVSPQPEDRLLTALQNYDLLKQDFWGSEYLALAAFLLADLPDPGPVEERVSRGRGLYRRMKQEHPFLTSSEDSVFAVLMAYSPRTDDELIDDMEACYHALRARFSAGDSLQAVSHVLALSEGSPEEKSQRVIDLFDALRQAGAKYGKYYQLPALAALAALNLPPQDLAPEILDASEFLSTQKGYGIFGLDKRTRLMHGVMLCADLHAPLSQVDTAALTGTLSMIVAQEMAMCAIIASSAAASAAAASSSSNS